MSIRDAMPWIPPVYLYAAAREVAADVSYRHDASLAGPSRVLIKRSISGTGTLYVGTRRLDVPPGWAFVIERPGPYRYCYEQTREPWRFEFVTIGFRDVAEILPRWLKRDPLIALKDFPELDQQFAKLVASRLADSSREDLLQSAQAYRFFLGYVATKSKAALARDRNPIARCRRTIEQRFREPLSVAELATDAGYATESLIRKFRQSYGVTPRHFVNLLRIRHACRLLEAGELPLKNIARECGFSSPHYFGRTFRQFLGVSPGAYRKHPDPLRPELT
jgi:AraC-like DNA-binding protein